MLLSIRKVKYSKMRYFNMFSIAVCLLFCMYHIGVSSIIYEIRILTCHRNYCVPCHFGEHDCADKHHSRKEDNITAALPYPTLHYPTLQYPTLPNPTLLNPTLPVLSLHYPTAFLVLPDGLLSCCSCSGHQADAVLQAVFLKIKKSLPAPSEC